MSAPAIRLLLPLVLAAALSWVSGCQSTYQVKIDAISKPGVAGAQSYRIRYKNGSIPGEESLREKEAADFVRTALSGKGFYEAPNAAAADLVIEIDFGIENPRTKMEDNSVPIYAQVGGGIRYETVPVTTSDGRTALRTVAVHQPPRTELVGYQNMAVPVTTYEKYLNLKARENKAREEGAPPTEVWNVRVSSVDESDDLRKYLPILASASIDYIGVDSTSQQTVKVRDGDSGVSFVRKGL
jgi:hypothetical protein